jgi:hypothetical protein
MTFMFMCLSGTQLDIGADHERFTLLILEFFFIHGELQFHGRFHKIPIQMLDGKIRKYRQYIS